MKVNEFVERYNQHRDKDEYVKKHIITEYIPYLVKVEECKKIILKTSYAEDSDLMNVDSASKHFLFLCRIILLYTDIEINIGSDELFDDFDLLNKNGCIDSIISNLPITEYKEFCMLLDLCTDDFITNNQNTINYIKQKITGWELGITTFIDSILNLISENPDVVEKILNKSE